MLQSVQDSDEIFPVISSWMLVRHCVTNEQKILAHGYVSLQCAEKRSFVLPMGTARWRVILELTEQQPLCHTHSIGQGCTLILHISCAHVKHVLLQKVLIINVLEQRLIPQSLFNHLQAGPWI